MPTKCKIKINDQVHLRKELDDEYESSSQVEVCQFALLLAKHILSLVGYDYINDSIITNGFIINEKWQKQKARMHDVRQAALQIHKKARLSEDNIKQLALRVTGHCVATAHMKEHAMVASDYAIKLINLLYPNDINAVINERNWQIDCLKKVKLSNDINM